MNNLYIISFIIAMITSYICISLDKRFSKKRRIYVCDEGWIPISTLLPEEDGRAILITDGEKVRDVYRLTFNNEGACILFAYDVRIVTHWRYFPLPPNNS